jgi:hypothetical protein
MILAEETTREITYKCSNGRCGHTQTLRFWDHEPVFPVLCCVECRNGFDGTLTIEKQMSKHAGMFPISA